MKKALVLIVSALFVVITLSASASATAPDASASQTPSVGTTPQEEPPKPEVTSISELPAAAGQPAAPTEGEVSTDEKPQNTAFTEKERVLLAYYGHPNSRYMGIVGRHSLPELVERVQATANTYQDVLPEYQVVPAIYLIYGTVQPAGNILCMRDEMVSRYIEYAAEHNVQIILDHQIGRFTLKEAMNKLLPFLKYPHVHLAVDFEWRTSRPMEEIGFVRGEELTWMQEYMSAYMQDNKLEGTRYLIFHQFKAAMVRNHAGIKIGFPLVELVHSTSGWGAPRLKRDTHAYNATITQIPTKAFKLWYYYSDKPGIHYDSPLMTPAEVAALSPQPKIIIYQ